jgi:uracil-DNA glycosylase
MSKLGEILFSLEDIGGWKEEFEKKRKKIERVFEKVEGRGSCYYPNPENVFKAFQLTPLEEVRVVIWGQDPYPTLLGEGKPRAQGYSFGVAKDDIIPKSLVNIYKEIKEEYPQFKSPNHGDLTYVAKQGVLFLNSALTYCPDEEKDKRKYSHINIWTNFTKIVVDIINVNTEKCIHVFWGQKSQKMKDEVPEGNVLIAAHPSPMSAYRGFFGCNHFIKINIMLDRMGRKQINWNTNSSLKPTYQEKLKKKSKKEKVEESENESE